MFFYSRYRTDTEEMVRGPSKPPLWDLQPKTVTTQIRDPYDSLCEISWQRRRRKQEEKRKEEQNTGEKGTNFKSASILFCY